MKFTKILTNFVALLVLFVMSSCTQVIVVTSTPDPNIIRTEAVKTAMSQLTQFAAANPTNTPPATPKPVIVTLVPSSTASLVPTITAQPTLTVTPKPVYYGEYKTFTPTVYNPNKAKVLSTDPNDWTTIPRDTDFDIRWWVRNVGSQEWTTAYWIQYISGSSVHKKEWYHLRNTVSTGDDYQFIVDARSGLETGLLSTRWGIYDSAGNLFQMLTLNVYVK